MTYTHLRNSNDLVLRRDEKGHPFVIEWDAENGRPLDEKSEAYARWIADGAPRPNAYDGPATPARTLSQNQWATVMEELGYLDKWLGLMTSPAIRPRDRAYFITGGEGGRYAESSNKLKRLASSIGVEVKTIFNAALEPA